ncbi:MAG: tryptophan halogenase family protein, partial [Pseudomonadota bacterium]
PYILCPRSAQAQLSQKLLLLLFQLHSNPCFHPDSSIGELPYAYHFDSALYGQFLRRYSERLGVKRIEGLIDDVTLDGQTGHVTAVQLAGGDAVAGDFFIDCSGARGLLIKQALEADFEDWGHWLPCDRALAVPSERFENTALFTRSIAHDAGWQWRIPLQHRNGNGLVYSSAHLDDNAAADRLMGNLDTRAQADPKLIRFQTGRTRQQWHRNVTAIGLSSGFLEPLESTSIYLIQSAIVRLIHLFPHQGVTKQLVDEYNRQAKIEWETIRDFIILHYHLNERDDGDFWKDVRHMSIPDRIRQKIDMFRSNGTLQQDQFDIFLDPSWLQVMLGQGVTPRDYHPLADNVTDSQLREKLINTHKTKQQPLERLPTHDEFLRAACEA